MNFVYAEMIQLLEMSTGKQNGWHGHSVPKSLSLCIILILTNELVHSRFPLCLPMSAP